MTDPQSAERAWLRTLVRVAFRLECGCVWRLGRGGPLRTIDVLSVGSTRDCWNGHGEQTVVEVRTVRV